MTVELPLLRVHAWIASSQGDSNGIASSRMREKVSLKRRIPLLGSATVHNADCARELKVDVTLLAATDVLVAVAQI